MKATITRILFTGDVDYYNDSQVQLPLLELVANAFSFTEIITIHYIAKYIGKMSDRMNGDEYNDIREYDLKSNPKFKTSSTKMMRSLTVDYEIFFLWSLATEQLINIQTLLEI